MDKSQNALMAILECDNTNVDVSIKALQSFGLFDLYKHMPILFEGLIREIEQYLGSLPTDPYVWESPNGTKKPALDVILRVHMTLSAHQQLIQATGHLLRGHLSEVYGHARRAIEAAGIAYLSKSEPDLGELYLAGDRKAFGRHTSTKKILPQDNPLTKDLHQSIDIASGQAHNNFSSFVTRIRHSVCTDKEMGKQRFTSLLLFHEADPQDPSQFFRSAVWILRIAERVARLLAASFALLDSIWHRRLEYFQAELNARCRDLYPLIRPKGKPPVK